MPSPTSFKFIVPLLLSSTILSSVALVQPHLSRRCTISSSDLQQSYDYIIIGGGLSGLVLASRLSEDPQVSVLVLEAGESGEEDRLRIDTPSGAFYNSIVGTKYDWAHSTVPQVNMANRSIGWPRGKVLGGSTAMNAMYLVRPSSIEMDAWAEMLDAMDDDESGISAQTYNWQNMYFAMRLSENFRPPLPDPQRIGNIRYDARNYGAGGPVGVSFPAVQISVTGAWTSTLASQGIPPLLSPNGGKTLGGYITPSTINTSNWTRASAYNSYITPLPPRTNLHILPKAHVTRIVFSDVRTGDELVATGVEYAESAESPRRVVNVSKEVVVSAGPVGSAKVLMLSGVGPRDVLEHAGVGVMEELGGVGEHLQDHVTGGITWRAHFETAGDIYASQSDFSRTPEFLSAINNAISFVNLSTLFSHSPEALSIFRAQISSSIDSNAALLPSSYSEVKEGYKVIARVNAEKFLSSSEVPQLEILMSVVGNGVVGLQAALQHPFSTGRIYINSSNPFDDAVIDPRYFSHPADITLLRQGMKLTRTIGAAFQAQQLFGDEVYPGIGVQSDEDWENWLRNEGGGTQYHPTASCVMLPRSLGGVVDKRMKVHGLRNVRVVDSSVYPFEFAAHLASTTYGQAEQGARLIKDNPLLVSASLSTSDARGFSVSILAVLIMSCMFWHLWGLY